MSQRIRPPSHVRKAARLAADLAMAVTRQDADAVRRLSREALTQAAQTEKRRQEHRNGQKKPPQ